MAIAIQSTSTGSESSSTTLTLTKPTGLAVGDLMLAVICHFDTSGVFPSVPSGWSNELSFSPADDNVMIRVFTKNAESSDVAASNFGFSVSSLGNNLDGLLYRIDGHGAITKIEDIIQGEGTESGGSYSFSDSTTPSQADSLLIAIGYGLNNENDFSGWTITGGTNPTWTERTSGVNGSGVDARYEVADATYNSVTTITGGSFALSTGYTAAGMAVLVLPPSVSVEVTPTTQTATFTTVPPSISGEANVSIASALTATFTIQSPVAETTTVNWDYEVKPDDSVWVIENL